MRKPNEFSDQIYTVKMELGAGDNKAMVDTAWQIDKGDTVPRFITANLKRFADSSDWENYWDKKMNILANVVVLVRNYKASRLLHKISDNNTF